MSARIDSPFRSGRRIPAQRAAFGAVCWTALIVAGFAAPGPAEPKPPSKGKKPMILQISSTSFAPGQPIPERHTCQGRDTSPQLKWSGAPPNTKSFALIADDPDAPTGTWVHWVVFDLPPTTAELPEDTPKSQHLPGGAKQGLNDFKRLGYGGPCPPPGKPHRYFFKIYALDKVLELKPGVTKEQVLKAMEGHVLAEGELMGTYQRK